MNNRHQVARETGWCVRRRAERAGRRQASHRGQRPWQPRL